MGLPDVDRGAGRLGSADPQLLAEVLESILRVCEQGVWVVDTEGRTVVANGKMAELLGAPVVQFATGTRVEVPLPAITLTLRERLAQRAAGVGDKYVLQVILPDGHTRSLVVSASPRYDRSGRHVGAIATYSDATDQPEPEARLTVAEAMQAMFWAATLKLSARESQVVQRLLTGDRVPEIARSLSATQSAVRNQLASVLRKAGVESQQELITLMREQAQSETSDE